MSLRLSLTVLSGLTALAVLSAVAIHHPTPAPSVPSETTRQQFVVRGVIRAVDQRESTITIEHDNIPGFMPAMTMPFTVKDPSLLVGLVVDAMVKFRLMVTDDDSWIANVEKTGAESASKPAVTAALANATKPDDVPSVNAGDTVPDFTLTDQNGRRFHLRDFRGKAVLMTFIYTRCPLPNFCPLMSKNFQSLQKRLRKKFPGRFELVSVSFDPQFDTPATLKAYAARYDADEHDWIFATGTDAQIDYVTTLFGLTRQAENGLIAHGLRTALIRPDGRLVHVWRSNVWTPYEVQREVEEVIQGLRAR
ncbi:MAG: SCO family protein [Verrucomicrobia bacterium]|nr:SCO family protein [Verrucomicrobiota bacterium]